jgi:hypothetical protein
MNCVLLEYFFQTGAQNMYAYHSVKDNKILKGSQQKYTVSYFCSDPISAPWNHIFQIIVFYQDKAVSKGYQNKVIHQLFGSAAAYDILLYSFTTIYSATHNSAAWQPDMRKFEHLDVI